MGLSPILLNMSPSLKHSPDKAPSPFGTLSPDKAPCPCGILEYHHMSRWDSGVTTALQISMLQIIMCK